MTCYQSTNLPGGVTTTGRTSYTTEADCLQACREGACCEGTTCTVKPQCQCQGTGKVFKGVGTVCTAATCTPCGCAAGAAPNSLLVQITGASLQLFRGSPGNMFYDELRTGGSCESDAAMIAWLNATAVPVNLFSVSDVAAVYAGTVATQGPFSAVTVGCVVTVSCAGGLDVVLYWCPDSGSAEVCMAWTSSQIPFSFPAGSFCTFAPQSRGVTTLFSQYHYTLNITLPPINGIGVLTCRGNIGTAASQAVARFFNGTVTVSRNPLP